MYDNNYYTPNEVSALDTSGKMNTKLSSTQLIIIAGIKARVHKCMPRDLVIHPDQFYRQTALTVQHT